MIVLSRCSAFEFVLIKFILNFNQKIFDDPAISTYSRITRDDILG